VIPKQRIEQPAVAPIQLAPARRQARWRLALGVLTQLGVGAEAVPAAILFRLLNFWMLLPIAAACYSWLMHDRPSR